MGTSDCSSIRVKQWAQVMAACTVLLRGGLLTAGGRYVMTVPIAFTSDHVETLFEIDIEYAEVLCRKPARTVLKSLRELVTDTALTTRAQH